MEWSNKHVCLSVELKGRIGAFGVQARGPHRTHEFPLGFLGHFALSSHHRRERNSVQLSAFEEYGPVVNVVF